MGKSISAFVLSSPDRLIRVKELRQMLGGASSSTIYRWIAKGILPEPRRISPRYIGWRFADIEKFLAGYKNEGGCHD